MATPKPKKSARVRVAKTNPKLRPRVLTIRLDEGVQKGLQMLKANSGAKLSLNKMVNAALAALIDKRAATFESELDQALRNIRASRQSDPGYKRAIKAFIDAEVAFAAEDPMEGAQEPQAAGPAVSMVREMLRG
jgi:hypothetical protein